MIVIIGKQCAPFSVIELNMIMLLLLEPFKDVVQNCTVLDTTISISVAFQTLIERENVRTLVKEIYTQLREGLPWYYFT